MEHLDNQIRRREGEEENRRESEVMREVRYGGREIKCKIKNRQTN